MPQTDLSFYEVAFTALDAPTEARECIVLTQRLASALVADRRITRAASAVFFERCSSGCVLVLRCASEEVLESLPLSYGSPLGHFGIFERSCVRTAGGVMPFRAVYSIAPQFSTYSAQTRLRLTRQVARRLAQYTFERAMAITVQPDEITLTIVARGPVADLQNLPSRFNAVFVRSAVLELHAQKA